MGGTSTSSISARDVPFTILLRAEAELPAIPNPKQLVLLPDTSMAAIPCGCLEADTVHHGSEHGPPLIVMSTIKIWPVLERKLMVHP